MEIILGWTDWKMLAFRKNLTPSQVLDLIREGKHNNRIPNMITLNNPEYLKAIWKPNLYIYDLEETSQPKLMSNLVTLKYDAEGGYINYITKVILRFSVPMEFEYYPLDTHAFTFRIRGFSYNENLLNLMWEKPPVFADHDHPNFDVQLESFAQSKAIIHDEKFNLLSFKIIFRRKISYHVVQTFIPSFLLILITWLCFFMPQRLVEVRVGICMTTVLTLTAMQDRQGSPKSAYVKALDIWMVNSIFFVFLILVQFALLIWLNNRKIECEKEETQDMSPPVSVNVRSATKNFPNRWNNGIYDVENGHGFYVKARKVRITAKRKLAIILRCIWILESVAFPMFLTLFFIFSGVYWGCLIVKSNFMNWPVPNKTLNPNL
ncbi:glycine receptor subunit alpha-2 isoform X1 [Folsomia candida]|nr:glycine receptor subunit alpha-2 isoform X1 [Folsomia candida]